MSEPAGLGAALEVVNALEREGFVRNYAIGGAIAVMFHAEPILTYDLDVFVMLPGSSNGLLDLGPVYRRLEAAGGRADHETVVLKGIPVQLIPAYNALVEEAVGESLETNFEGTPTRVVGYEHLLAIMLQTGRPKDRERLVSLCGQRPPDRAVLDAILRRYGLSERWRALAGDP